MNSSREMNPSPSLSILLNASSTLSSTLLELCSCFLEQQLNSPVGLPLQNILKLIFSLLSKHLLVFSCRCPFFFLLGSFIFPFIKVNKFGVFGKLHEILLVDVTSSICDGTCSFLLKIDLVYSVDICQLIQRNLSTISTISLLPSVIKRCTQKWLLPQISLPVLHSSLPLSSA